MEKFFKLKENGTTVRTEILAGLTTFMTMAYIIALNPNLLTGFGANGQEIWNAVFMATCIASAIGIFCMAFLANKPFAMAPGMGLNSFFAVVVANIAGLTGMHHLPDSLHSEHPGEDRGGHSSGRAVRHCPRHRPDADEHRPGL